MKEHVGISKLKKHRNKIGIVQNYTNHLHDVIRDVERKKETKKERKTPEAMENEK